MPVMRKQNCSKCNGSGELPDLGKIAIGLLSWGATWAADSGEGEKVFTKDCPVCVGSGYTWEVKIHD